MTSALAPRVSPSGPYAPGSGPPASGVSYGPYSARPVPNGARGLYLVTDGPISFIDTGAWQPLVNGVLGVQVPAVADFTASFTGAAGGAIADSAGTLIGTVGPSGGQSSFGLVVDYAANQTAVVHVRVAFAFPTPPGTGSGGIIAGGLCLRDSATGGLRMAIQNVYSIANFTSVTAVDVGSQVDENAPFVELETQGVVAPSGEAWLRVVELAGVRSWGYSLDGYSWIELLSEAGGGYDQVGIISSGLSAGLVSWDSFSLT